MGQVDISLVKLLLASSLLMTAGCRTNSGDSSNMNSSSVIRDSSEEANAKIDGEQIKLEATEQKASTPGKSEGGDTSGRFIGTGSLAIVGNGSIWVSVQGNGAKTRKVRVEVSGCRANVQDLQINYTGTTWSDMKNEGDNVFSTISGLERAVFGVNVLVKNANGNCHFTAFTQDYDATTLPAPLTPPPVSNDSGVNICSGFFNSNLLQQWMSCVSNGRIQARTVRAYVDNNCTLGAQAGAIQMSLGGEWKTMTPARVSRMGGIEFSTLSGLQRPIFGVNVLLVNQAGPQLNCRMVVTKVD